MRISRHTREMLLSEKVVLVGTANKRGVPNVSPKGVVSVDCAEGTIYFVDLYGGRTYRNLKENPQVSIAVVNYHEFCGYQFKGHTSLVSSGPLFENFKQAWERRSTGLLIERIIQNVRQGHSHGRSELHLPEPKHLVRVKVEKIIDLAPRGLKLPGAVSKLQRA
jgi:predicted pyridoxine 5'-phosphate oxidase superfamily flavin-nucleotide-binding protein